MVASKLKKEGARVGGHFLGVWPNLELDFSIFFTTHQHVPDASKAPGKNYILKEELQQRHQEHRGRYEHEEGEVGLVEEKWRSARFLLRGRFRGGRGRGGRS